LVRGWAAVSTFVTIPLSWNFQHLAEAKALKQPSRGVALRPSFAEIGFSDFWPLATAPKFPHQGREKKHRI